MAKKKRKEEAEIRAAFAVAPLPEALGRTVSVVQANEPRGLGHAVPEPIPAHVDLGAPLRIRTPLSPVFRNGVVVCYVEPGADLGFLR